MFTNGLYFYIEINLLFMDSKPSRRFDNRAILGLVVLFIGVLLLIDNLGWLTFNIMDVIFSLPFLAIIIGIMTITRGRSLVFGYLLIIAGIVFLLLQIFNIQYNHERAFWSIVLISIGLTILLHNKRRSNHSWKHHHHWHNDKKSEHYEYWFKKSESTSDMIDEINIFGGCERKITSHNFLGGTITSIFGGGTYDMRDCELADGKIKIDIVYIFGGSKMIIPAHWKVHIEVISIFGGFSDKRSNLVNNESGNNEIFLTGVTIFGGGEIRSF
jgi:predicted membrane protein